MSGRFLIHKVSIAFSYIMEKKKYRISFLFFFLSFNEQITDANISEKLSFANLQQQNNFSLYSLLQFLIL